MASSFSADPVAANDLTFVLAFDYSLRDPSGNTACTTCPSGFAFMLADQNNFQPGGAGAGSPGFGLAPGTVANSQYHVGLLFDHLTVCNAFSNTNFHGLYSCSGTSNCSAYTGATNNPPAISKLNGCTQDHHVVITMSNDACTVGCANILISVQIDGTTTFSKSIAKTDFTTSIISPVPALYWGFTALSPTNNVTIYNIEYAYQTTAGTNGACFVAGCKEGTTGYNNNVSAVCVLNPSDESQRTCACAAGYYTTDYQTFSNQPASVAFPRCLAVTSQCSRFGCDKFATCTDTGPYTRTCTCPAGYNGTATGIGPGLWSPGCTRDNPCPWRSITSATGQLVFSGSGGATLAWLNSGANTTFFQQTNTGVKCAWYNTSSTTGFALSATVHIQPNKCPSGSPGAVDITGQFVMAVNNQGTSWCGANSNNYNGLLETGSPTTTKALGWEVDPANLDSNGHLVRDVCSNVSSAVSAQTSNCWNGFCDTGAVGCTYWNPWYTMVMYYYPSTQPGTNATEGASVVTFPNGVFAFSLGSSTTYDIVHANTTGALNYATFLGSNTVWPGFAFGDGKHTTTVGNIAIVQSATCPASCLASSCGDDTYNRGRVTCIKGSTRPEDTRTCRCIPGYDFGPYTFVDQGLAVLPPYCVPTLYFCNTYGGCGANAVCSELAAGSNARLCTCSTGYTTVSGITNWTLYGSPADGQGYFGGKISTANGGDGCTVQIDMCALYGCGANSYCTNAAANQRTCTCQIGWKDSLNRTSVTYTGSTNATDCSTPINTCGNDFNVACTFLGLLTRFLNCTNGYSIDGSPISATSKTVYGINNPFSCYSINFCNQLGCGVNATCLSTFNTRHCTCTPGTTFLSSGSALGSNFSIVGQGAASGCPYQINYCLQTPNGAGTPLGSPVATNYGCNNLHTSCVPGFRNRLCTCDPGYSLDGLNYFNNNVTVPTIQFGSACIAVDMCTQYGCNDAYGTTCTLNGANSRICTCAQNYEVNTSHLTAVALNGPVAWGGCTPIDYCTLPGYGCGANANCVNSGVGERTCTCVNGWTSSQNNSRVGEVFIVYNDDASPGCTKQVDGCLPAPDGYGCGANANCTRLFNAINCKCQAGYGITDNYYDNNVTLVYTQTYPGCNTVVDMCTQFGCVANEAPSVNCTNTAVNERECECPPGFSGSDTLTGSANHSKTCQSINLCTLYGCGGDPNADCKNPVNFTGNRTCECHVGYDGTEDLFNDTQHTWCREIDMCKRFGCQNFMLQCTFVKSQANKRVCSCAPGTAEYAGAGLSELILGNLSSSITCTDLNECDLYPCTDPRRNQSTTCIEYDNSTGPRVNQRVCQCPNGFVGTAAVQGDNEFLGCAPPLAVSGIQSLGFTLQNGFWNKWEFYTVLDINLDGIDDFFYQDSSGELGYIIFYSAFVWKQYPALDAIQNKNQYCANPKPYAFTNGPPVNVICMNRSGDVLLNVWESDAQFFYQFPLTTGAYTFSSAPESDYWEDSTGTGYVLYNDANRTLVLRRPSSYNYTSHALDLQLTSYPNTFTAPPTQFYGLVVRPVMFDIDGDDTFDTLFGWQETENEKFSWYLQSATADGSFSLLGELSTPFYPEHVKAARLSSFAPAQTSLIATTSACYALYYLPDVTNVKPNDRVALEDASCSNCGCGTSQGLVLGDLNDDGQEDLAVLQNGGASFYYGFYSENQHFGFTSVLLLGGADHLIFYPWENNSLLQAVFISDGVSAVYSFLSGDECAMGTHDCPQYADCIYTNSGFGRYGFTCNCSTGFYEVASTDSDPRHFTCADVDECAVNGANGNPGGCGLNSTCVNTVGSYYCNCTDGYFLLSNKITCIESLDCAWFDWTDWGTCSCGIELRRQRIEDRSRSVKPDSCRVEDSLELRMCDPYSFCVSDDLITTIEQARNKLLVIFSDIYMQYAYGQFAPFYLLVAGGNHSTNSTGKRDEMDEDQTVSSNNPNYVVFENAYCNTTELANATSSLLAQSVYFLALPSSWIVGKATYANNTNPNNSYIYDGANCTSVIDLSGCFPASYIGIAVGIPIGIFFLLTFIAIIIYLVRRWLLKKRLKVVKNLPRECTVHFRDCIKHPDDWEQIETDPPTWRKELTKDDDKEFVLDLFSHLDGDGIGVKNIYAVYNRSLVTQLSLTKQKFDNRASKDSQLFFAEKWKMQEESESRIRLRQWTKDNFLNRMSDFEWNHNDRVGILPVIHGTSINIAWKVCVGGFANLSVLDVGFYGSGIYFTTSAKYSIPYFATKPNPAIIISYLIPGNPFPVVEQPSAKDNIAGNTLKPGYQSHFVSTTSRGVPHTKPTKHHVFDEIVINQESQVAPAYVLVLDTSSFISLIKQFERKTLEADVALNSRDIFSDNRDRDGYVTI